MKKTVPFEIFGANQYLMFDNMRLAELNRALGHDVAQLIAGNDIGHDFVLKALPIAMKQHYFQATPEFFAEKMDEYDENVGGAFTACAVPLVRAILVTGLLGSAVRDRVIEQMNKLAGGEEPKNEPGTATPTPSKPSKRGSTGPKQ